jgi:hypothetical protein
MENVFLKKLTESHESLVYKIFIKFLVFHLLIWTGQIEET